MEKMPCLAGNLLDLRATLIRLSISKVLCRTLAFPLMVPWLEHADVNTVCNIKCEWISWDRISYAVISPLCWLWRPICGFFFFSSAMKYIPAGHLVAVHASKLLICSFVWGSLTSLLAQLHFLTFCFHHLLYQHFFHQVESLFSLWFQLFGDPQPDWETSREFHCALLWSFCDVYASGHDVSPPAIQRAKCKALLAGAS